ncbi:aminopeptidase [Alicyclobacillus dauci]|uniref:Aminopeptidase n=1 Tax=Alicyclobacillus dauci TaxID=1475485 RepID=A0ABY6Z3X0_9BACL|nr:aminopeptidase [Alicyclobacillus dauci]WAH37218.1 aminopeptidase [Alicyclobacillus dauci]
MTSLELEQSLQKYARLIVRFGVAVSKGQTVHITAPIERVDIVRLVAAEAYDAGAKAVEIVWQDDDLTRIRYEHAQPQAFESFPEWKKQKFDDLVAEGAAFITIYAPNPGLLEGIDGDKVAADNKLTSTALQDYRMAMQKGLVRRTMVSAPTAAWAKAVFPDKSVDDAIDALWQQIFQATRIDTADPLAAWTDHVGRIQDRLALLNDAQFKELRYRAPGTELTVELPQNHVWIGGGLNDPAGVFHMPNMPTEEVFTAPKRDGVHGTVRSTKPLNYNGSVIDNFSITFEHGRIVHFDAETGRDALARLIDTDEGSDYLGEVALVPDNSPISNSGITFKNTLFDENASCHLAIGMAYPFCIEGGVQMSPAELTQRGLNVSLVHEDFMVGSRELDIDGVRPSGEVVPLFRQGNWVE